MAQLQSSAVTGSLVVTGTLTAQEFHTEFISSSILHESGSTSFGNSSDDIHNMTGSLKVLGDGNFTGTLTAGTVSLGTGDLTVNGDILALGQIRASGWWNTNSSNASGTALEIGVSGPNSTEAYILSYDRTNSSYGDINFAAVNFNFDERGGTTTIENNEIWHAGNDGAGSGLDADTLDTYQASAFPRKAEDATISGNYNFTGTSTKLPSHFYTNRYDSAGNVYFHVGTADSVANTLNLRVYDASNSVKTLVLNGGTGAISWNGSTIWHAGNDGAGTGLDADLLDGVQGSGYVRSDAEHTRTKSLIIDEDWGNGTYDEQLTILGTYPSLAFRSTNANSNGGSVWLMHQESSGDLTWYNQASGPGGSSWAKRMDLEEGGNLYLTNGSVNANTTISWNNGVGALSYSTGYVTMETNSATAIRLKTNSTDRLTILSDGKVGIGTTSPSQKLHIFTGTPSGAATLDSNTAIAIDSAANQYLQFRTSSGSSGIMQGLLFTDNGNNAFIGFKEYSGAVAGTYGESVHFAIRDFSATDAGSGFYFGTTNDPSAGVQTPLMFIRSNGNISVGTTNAYARFSVKATSHNNGISVNRQADTTAAIYIGNDGGNNPVFAANNADMLFGRDLSGTFTERMRLTNGGNLGIGTTSPQKKLEVITSTSDFASVGVNQMGVGNWTGIHFGYRENNTNYRKSAIVFQRTDYLSNNAQGKIHILNGPLSGAGSATLSDAHLTIGEEGYVGIGTTSPSSSLEVYGSGSTVLDIQGSQGQLFSITDNLTGDLFSVSDISGIPILNVNSSGDSYFDGSLGIGTTSLSSIHSLTVSGSSHFSGSVDVGTGLADTVVKIRKADNNVADHIQFYNGTTRVGEIGVEDDSWLRINQVTNKNIYTPRYIRADAGLFVDSTSYGINGSGRLLDASLSGTYTNALTFSGGITADVTGNLTGTASNASALSSLGLTGAGGIGIKLFNNQGRNHSTYTNFNDTALRAGVNYLQGGTNGPTGTAGHQWYGFRLGLGDDYGTQTGASNNYASEIYWARAGQGGSQYLFARDMEGGNWSSWRKLYAGYADSAGAVAWSNITSKPTTLSGFGITDGISTSSSQSNALYIRNTSPTIYLRDTDHISSMIHQNSNLFYILRADAADDVGWTSFSTSDDANGRWPLEVNLTNSGHYFAIGSPNVTAGGNTVWHQGNDGAGTGLDADLLDGQHGSYYAIYDHIRSLGTTAFTTGTTTTAGIISEMEGDGAFDSYTSVFKTSWSYAGNINITDGGTYGPSETAGMSFLTWTDTSSDTTRGNITFLAIAPNTGGSAGRTFIYNDQGSGYDPGWREIWTSRRMGSGTGLDADKLDGLQGSSYLRSDTSDTFSGTLTMAGTLTLGNNSISGVNDLSFNDPGYQEGITWSNGNGWYIQECPDNMSNAAGNLQISTSSTRRLTIDTSGNVEAPTSTAVISAGNHVALNCAQWASSGSSTGAIKITLPGSTGNYSMPVIRITTYEYNSRAHAIYTISGHNWSTASNWYNTRVTSEGANPYTVRLGHDGSTHCIIIGETNTAWSYGHVTVELLAHPEFYTSGQDMTVGWGISQITSLPSTVTTQTVGKLWHSANDGASSGLDADTLDTLHASSFLRSDGTNSLYRVTAGDGNRIRFWDSDNYAIWMSSANNSTWGGRVPGETTSDYNMYFRMTAGTNRGFVFQNGTTEVAGIDASGNIRSIADVIAYSSSDRKFKDNLIHIGKPVDKIKQLSGYEFTWNNNQTTYQEGTKDIGVVAQEVENVLPEIVNTREDGSKAVKYEKLVALLIEGMKEQQEQIESLKARIDELENK